MIGFSGRCLLATTQSELALVSEYAPGLKQTPQVIGGVGLAVGAAVGVGVGVGVGVTVGLGDALGDVVVDEVGVADAVAVEVLVGVGVAAAAFAAIEVIPKIREPEITKVKRRLTGIEPR